MSTFYCTTVEDGTNPRAVLFNYIVYS